MIVDRKKKKDQGDRQGIERGISWMERNGWQNSKKKET